MTAAPHVALDGVAVKSLTLRVGSVGPWVADVHLTDAHAASGRVALTIGSATLIGTLIAQRASTFGLGFSARIVAGAGHWSAMLPSRSYHNDAGIKARLIAEDAAREAGETLGDFEPSGAVVGVDFVRVAAAASVTLEYAAGAIPWWVDYAGVTHAKVRATSVLAEGFDLLSFDPTNNVATLALDNFGAFGIGSVISDARMEAPLVVRDFELSTRDGSPLRVTAWGGGAENGEARLPGLVRRLVEHVQARRLFGLYRYRVVSVAGDRRVDLQAVRADAGLPDARAVPQWPGVAGCSAQLRLGSEVLVQFIDGDPTEPAITQYVGPGGPGFAGSSVELHSPSLTLGAAAGPPVARQGDTVEVMLPPAQFVGTVGGAPATGVVTWIAPTASGVITSGSGKVKAAT